MPQTSEKVEGKSNDVDLLVSFDFCQTPCSVHAGCLGWTNGQMCEHTGPGFVVSEHTCRSCHVLTSLISKHYRLRRKHINFMFYIVIFASFTTYNTTLVLHDTNNEMRNKRKKSVQLTKPSYWSFFFFQTQKPNYTFACVLICMRLNAA